MFPHNFFNGEIFLAINSIKEGSINFLNQ